MVVQGFSHLVGEVIEPGFEFVSDRDVFVEFDDFVDAAEHFVDSVVAFEIEAYDSLVQFSEVVFDDALVFGVGEKFEEVIVSDEVQAREFVSFVFQKIVQRLLALFELVDEHVQGVLDSDDLENARHFEILVQHYDDVSEFVVDSFEPALFFGQGSATENGFQVDPLSLYEVEVCEPVFQIGEFVFVLLNLVLESAEVLAGLY